MPRPRYAGSEFSVNYAAKTTRRKRTELELNPEPTAEHTSSHALPLPAGVDEWNPTAYDWFFLAMIYQRLERTSAARDLVMANATP